MSVEVPYTGLTASVKLGTGEDAKVLAYISGVNLDLEKAIIEILKFGAGYKEKVPAMKDWNASVDGTVALAPGGTQKELLDAFENSTLLTMGIYLDATTYFTGTGYVSSFHVDAAPDDKINLSADIAGTGSVTLSLPSAPVT